MSEISGKKILSSGACGLDREEPPRQFMQETCKYRAGLDFWGWLALVSPGLTAETDPRDAYRWLLMIVLLEQNSRK